MFGAPEPSPVELDPIATVKNFVMKKMWPVIREVVLAGVIYAGTIMSAYMVRGGGEDDDDWAGEEEQRDVDCEAMRIMMTPMLHDDDAARLKTAGLRSQAHKRFTWASLLRRWISSRSSPTAS
jgi:hypothetical protein